MVSQVRPVEPASNCLVPAIETDRPGVVDNAADQPELAFWVEVEAFIGGAGRISDGLAVGPDERLGGF